ncbi:PREDICTED: protein transport protein Sec16A-like isoform X2 [Priapulus caudatus]|uniref:Protein transport protein sec16 n=1 Tax=Priapulus caudatus TaxID=37621 RepID=A0ABM1EBI7_PRICU|nr:PREDICTED: protein transport protein Sec16A-like isoform X2 [Priapulus caudatus]
MDRERYENSKYYEDWYKQQEAYYQNYPYADPRAYYDYYRQYGHSRQDSGYLAEMAYYDSNKSASYIDPNMSSADYYQQYDDFDRRSQHSSYVDDRDRSRSGSRLGYEESDGYSERSDDAVARQRLTPHKFRMPHTLATLTPSGALLKVLPNSPEDGQPARVELHDVQGFLGSSAEMEEMRAFPGPLVKSETHKKDVIIFCQNKIKECKADYELVDKSSAVLLWELNVLLIRQNGTVVGTDIADLLLADYQREHDDEPVEQLDDVAPVSPSGKEEDEESKAAETTEVVTENRTVINRKTLLSEEQVTKKFRDLLLYGHKKDALDWSMKHHSWGHALFLASKMDARTYANVMTRFANSLALNDPLQTLYQLMSGRQPGSVTSVADHNWGDWRPHLAMILSNGSGRSDLDQRSITSLADTLAASGCLHAAHFCYLMADVGFGTYKKKMSKLVLIGSNHRLPLQQFATNEAVHCTEVYEYAMSLSNPQFVLPGLQAYKFMYACRLAEFGFLQEALHYCEVLTRAFQPAPALYSENLVAQVYELGSRLKYHDPHYTHGEGEITYMADPDWLTNLSSICTAFKIGTIHHIEETEANAPWTGEAVSQPTSESVSTSTSVQDDMNMMTSEHYAQEQVHQYQSHSRHTSGQQQVYEQTGAPGPTDGAGYDYSQYNQYYQQQQQGQYFTPPGNYGEGYAGSSAEQQVAAASEHSASAPSSPRTPVADTTGGAGFDYYGMATQQYRYRESPRDEGGHSAYAGIYYTPPESPRSTTTLTASSPEPGKKVESPTEHKKKEHKKHDKRGWFGGIFNFGGFKGKNEMKLPEDKNPSIVWDATKNRWVNQDGDDEEEKPFAPPPKDSDMMGGSMGPYDPLPAVPVPAAYDPVLTPAVPAASYTQQQGLDANQQAPQPTPAPPAGGVNRFKMRGGKGPRSKYVDVLNPTGAPSSGQQSIAPPNLFPTNTSSPMNFFVPTPVSAESTGDSGAVDYVGLAQASTTDAASHPHADSQPQVANPAQDGNVQSYYQDGHAQGTNAYAPQGVPGYAPSPATDVPPSPGATPQQHNHEVAPPGGQNYAPAHDVYAQPVLQQPPAIGNPGSRPGSSTGPDSPLVHQWYTQRTRTSSISMPDEEPGERDDAELSRASSQSSLSSEVQRYMVPDKKSEPAAPPGPTLFDPAQFTAPITNYAQQPTGRMKYGQRRAYPR